MTFPTRSKQDKLKHIKAGRASGRKRRGYSIEKDKYSHNFLLVKDGYVSWKGTKKEVEERLGWLKSPRLHFADSQTAHDARTIIKCNLPNVRDEDIPTTWGEELVFNSQSSKHIAKNILIREGMHGLEKQ